MSSEVQEVTALDKADEVFGQVCAFMHDRGVPTFISNIVAGLVAGIVLIGNILLGVLVAGIVSLLLPVAQAIIRIIGTVRREGSPEFAALSAEVLSEMLGTEINAADIPQGTGPNSGVERARVIGGKLYDALIAEFTKGGAVSPETGEAAARAFTGFSVNFATASASIAALSELLSIGQVENFREIGEQTAQVLGLGRLQRHVLGVLLTHTIEKPYTDALAAKYRPNRLGDAAYVRGLAAGAFDEARVRQELAYKGYPDDVINRVLQDLQPHLNESQLDKLIRYGEWQRDEAVNELTVQGIPRNTADRVLQAVDFGRVDSKVDQYVNEIETQVLNGYIDFDTFRQLLTETPLSELEQHWELKFVGQKLEYPHARLTLSQVQNALVKGIIDFTYLDTWLDQEGYSVDDQLTLEFLTLEKALTAEAKQAALDRKKQLQDAKAAKLRAGK